MRDKRKDKSRENADSVGHIGIFSSGKNNNEERKMNTRHAKNKNLISNAFDETSGLTLPKLK